MTKDAETAGDAEARRAKVAAAFDRCLSRQRDAIVDEIAGAVADDDTRAIDMAVRNGLGALRSGLLTELSRELAVPADAGNDGLAASDVAAESGEEGTAESLQERLHEFSQRLEKAKVDLAQIHHPGQAEDRLATAMFELDEIMTATEKSTEEILASAEKLNELVTSVQARRENDEAQDPEQVNQLVDEVMRIFEACNFQDLTGQRIQKVVDTLIQIEQRLDSIVRHLGKDAFAHIPVPDERVGDPENLTGPAMQDSRTRPDQDTIDDIFES